MKIYTKTGDKGKSSLFGGQRVDKDDLRLNAYGTVDELNSTLGLSLSKSNNKEIQEIIKKIQNDLFKVGADLATPRTNSKVNISRIEEDDSKVLENFIDKLNVKLPEIRFFVLPGGTEVAAILNIARTICRRAEREVVSLSKIDDIGDFVLIYLNRLSDLLFVLARYDNFVNNHPEIKWEQ